jgi:hypothetical protein
LEFSAIIVEFPYLGDAEAWKLGEIDIVVIHESLNMSLEISKVFEFNKTESKEYAH